MSVMPFLELARRFVRGRLKAWAPQSVVRRVWNQEFREGSWDFIENTPGDCVYPLIERYAGNGSILDLGCGAGNTGNEIAFESYRAYTGVDISDVAVEKASRRAFQNGRSAKNRYVQGDICNYVPEEQYDVILFRESIWYIPATRLIEVLNRYRRHLTPSGVFIVRMFDRVLLKKTVETLKLNYELLHEYIPADAGNIVLVLR